jgi:hypothetical protein
MDATEYHCACCGKFRMTRPLRINLERSLDDEEEQLLPYLSAHTRQASEQGIVVELLPNNWQAFALAHQRTRVSSKRLMLLRVLANRSKYPGDLVSLDFSTDYPLIDAISGNELKFFLDHLATLGFTEVPRMLSSYRCRLTPSGWQEVEPLGVGPGAEHVAFIAMAFDSRLDDAATLGLERAIRDCGFDPIRVDRVEHNDDIRDRIMADIRRSRFVVADFTLQKSGVYFEAGFAAGLGLPVIWCCREDNMNECHFDTNHYNHILWTTPEDLYSRLCDRIRATIRV